MRWYPLKSGGCLGQTRNSPKTVSPLSFLAQIEALNTITLKTSNFARPEWCKPAWFCQLALRFVARRANLADLVKLGFDSLEIVQLRNQFNKHFSVNVPLKVGLGACRDGLSNPQIDGMPWAACVHFGTCSGLWTSKRSERNIPSTGKEGKLGN